MRKLNTALRAQEIISGVRSHLRDLGVSLEVELSAKGGGGEGETPDGSATLLVDGHELTLPVEIKSGLRPSTVGLVPVGIEGGLLLSDHITPAVGELLRGRRIQYADSVGNASIRGSGLVIEVQGRRAVSAAGSREASPLFTPAALPVVLAVLNEPQLLDAPLREVQQRTTVSLGTVQKVMSYLRDQNHLAVQGPQGHGWRRLYDGWTAAYLSGPRDNALIGRYSSDHRPRDLVRLLGGIDATPSGEAAAHLAGYDIAPSTFDLYVRDSMGPVIRAARLRPDPKGAVSLLDPSWTSLAEEESGRGKSGEQLAPAPVVYADLLAQQDPRITEIAMEWRSA